MPSAILPRDAWLELDTITTRVMRDDGGQPFMADLMALAKPVNIGTMAHLSRVASDTNNPVHRSLSGQVPVAMDKTVYDYRAAALLHDRLLDAAEHPKWVIDWLFMGALRASGVSALEAGLFWLAVRTRRPGKAFGA